MKMRMLTLLATVILMLTLVITFTTAVSANGEPAMGDPGYASETLSDLATTFYGNLGYNLSELAKEAPRTLSDLITSLTGQPHGP